MPKPVILAVDDDISVLEAIIQDLRRQYGANYRILRAGSGQAALDVCTQLQQRNDAVALFLSDQRMPGMTGVEFLEKAQALYPEAKRALLTAYADTNAAIGAINQASINYFFLKPWDPPAQNLYPQLNDLLDDWQASYRPAFQGIRVLGTRWSPRCY
jgi:thioredoxin reductase (NADPH)